MIYLVWRALSDDGEIYKTLVGVADTWEQAANIRKEDEASDDYSDFYYIIAPVVKNKKL